ncbi:MAG: DoxX family membrane protein [Desulfobacterota bacterium]|jgi:uncharacterized membrane protein YphA (DoxX/SURF4 family)|nr:DoxX family membrane protein [Thermodesulfobacteriota bacterium]
MRPKLMSIALLISRLILGGVFAYASFDKILHPYEFAEVVHNYQLLPDALINLTAILLPWLELSLGLFLILGRLLRGAVFTANALLAVFFLAIAFNWARGLDIDCGCFFSSAGPSTGGSMIVYLLRDAFFLAMSSFLLFSVLRRERLHEKGGGKITG